MEKNKVLLVLTEQWCDWEASYAIAVLNAFSEYKVSTVAVDMEPKLSMGGLKSAVDFTMDEEIDWEQTAIVILPGGLSWEECEYPEIAEFVKKVREKQIPVAAICGATLFLCRKGFLNDVKHTGDNRELFLEQKENYPYTGEALYQEKQVVVDHGIITANETAAVEFAYEIFKMLEIDETEEIEQWFDNFQNGAVR